MWIVSPGTGDTRLRATADGRSSVATVANSEPLAVLPAAPYPVIVTEQRTASRQALVSYRGNRYSVPPELAAASVVVSHPLRDAFIDIATTGGIVVARHRWPPTDSASPSATAGTSSRWTPPRWQPPTAGALTAARSASHPGRRPKLLPPNCFRFPSTALQLPNPQLIQPIPLSSICPPTSGPPSKGPSHDPHHPHPEDHPIRRAEPTSRRQPVSACAPIWPNSNCTPPPKPYPRPR